jgi:restriction system protein
MAVPTFDQLLRPILDLASRTPITRQSATGEMIKSFSLSEEDQQEAVSSGTPKIANRSGWAMSHLVKGGLISKVAKFTYQATEKGKSYLLSHKGPITVQDLKKIEGFQEAWAAASRKKAGLKEVAANEESATTSTPQELIDDAVESLDESLRAELIEHLHGVDPYRFEQVVLDLLFAMGYGGSRKEAARVTQKSNDEGLDGVISEDRLGLDVIYVQAKRWKNAVGRPEIQSFVGALAGKQAHKGVFITTSTFVQSAVEYAAMVSQKVILIDGARLTSLMIEHNIGVSTTRTIKVKRVDSDYFEEG